MDAAIDVASLEEAVTVFYRSNAQQQSAAHQWLIKAQQSQQAWSFVWDLMQLNKPSDVQFFGASTLHTKLMRYWQEVPKENRDELRQKLFAAIMMYANGPKIVLNRLCLSLSSFIVHMLPEHSTAIDDIVETFQNQQMPNVSPDAQTWIFLDILGGIPLEANSGAYTTAQKTTIHIEIAKRIPFVLNIVQRILVSKLEQPLSDNDMASCQYAVKCSENWLKDGAFPLDNCLEFTEVLTKITSKCYFDQTDADGCMTYEANDLAETSVKTIMTILTQPDAHRYSNSALRILLAVLEALTPITKAEYKESNQNEDIVYNIYTMIIASMETHSALLISGLMSVTPEHRKLYMMVVEEVIQCTDKPGIYPLEESCSTLAMGFWYMLQEEVLSNDSISGIRGKALEMIVPLYEHLATILVRKGQQPDDSTLDQWSSEDLESFRCYRQDIADTFLYCYEVLNTDLLHIFKQHLEESIAHCQSDASQWTMLESSLHAIYGIAEHIDTDERDYMPLCMALISTIPFDRLNEKVLGIALDTIGAYAEWLKDNPAFVPNAVQVILFGLNSTQTPQASFALKDMCRESQLQLKPNAEHILQACNRAMTSGHIVQSDEVRLMYSIGRLMSLLETQNVLQWLNVFVSPCFAELQSITQTQVHNDTNKGRTLFRLNMVSTLFSSLNTNLRESEDQIDIEPTKGDQQPVLMIMQQTMPIFKDVAALWAADNDICEGLCGALKYALTNLLDDMRPMLPDLCQLIVTMLQSTCMAPAIDIAKKCILLFYHTEDCQLMMRQLLCQVIHRLFYFMDSIPMNELSGSADVLEAFFNFTCLIAKKMPQALVDEEIDCDKMVVHATKVLVLPENAIMKNAVMFLQYFIMQSRLYARAMNAILARGEALLHTTLMAIGVYAQRNHVEVLSDVLLSLNKKYPAEFAQWIRMLEVENFPTPSVTFQEKQQFMRSILRERANRRAVQTLVNHFAARCRDILIHVP